MTIGAYRINSISKAPAVSSSMSLTFISGVGVATTVTTTPTPSVTANIGDIIVFFNSGTNTSSSSPPALATPSGFTNVVNIATPSQTYSQRTALSYQISTTNGARTLNGFTGNTTASYTVFVYRPSITATSVSFNIQGQVIQNAIITGQTLTFTSMTSSKIAFSAGYCAPSNNFLDSTTTPTRQIISTTSGGTNLGRVRTFEGEGFTGSSTTNYALDGGTNSLINCIMTVS